MNRKHLMLLDKVNDHEYCKLITLKIVMCENKLEILIPLIFVEES